MVSKSIKGFIIDLLMLDLPFITTIKSQSNLFTIWQEKTFL